MFSQYWSLPILKNCTEEVFLQIFPSVWSDALWDFWDPFHSLESYGVPAFHSPPGSFSGCSWHQVSLPCRLRLFSGFSFNLCDPRSTWNFLCWTKTDFHPVFLCSLSNPMLFYFIVIILHNLANKLYVVTYNAPFRSQSTYCHG